MTRSTLLHLRIPFSFFLMPIFLFGLAISDSMEVARIVIVFVSLHLFLYPASNGFNSYFDKDEKSIGGLRNPPKVQNDLYWTSMVFDFFALCLGLLIDWKYAIMLLIYGLVSKAYSHPSIRIKSKPVLGWLTVGVFQGYFTLLMTVYGVLDMPLEAIFNWKYQVPAILSSALLLGSYPMTQIYQHEEDDSRGDITLSLKLGIKGTFLFTGVFFMLSNMGFLYFLLNIYSEDDAIMFQLALTPVVVFFLYWFWKSFKNADHVNFKNAMRLNFISSFMLSAFFIYLVVS
ncbi:MAG: UbiA prenyltransferase family protein [Reichenbachiella sp.]